MDVEIAHQLGVIAAYRDPPPIVFKNFFIFVSKKQDDISKNVAGILGKMSPKTNMEKILKVKLIDKFQVSSEVLKLLQSTDSLYLNQAMKCTWFFASLPDPEGFVRDVIPNLSLSVRLKIINKYATHLKTSKSGEILYLNVKARYGIRSALSLLPACGENFIRSELPNIRITLPVNVALILLEKYPSLMIEYLKYLADDDSPKSRRQTLATYEKVLLKLSNHNLATFINLYESFWSNFPFLRLGRKATKRLIKNEPNKMVNNYEMYKRIIVEGTFFRRLPLAQFRELYVSHILPDDTSNFIKNSRKASTTLLYLKPSIRSQFLLTAFSSKYGRELTSDELLFNLDDIWLDYIPENSQKKFIEKKIADNVGNSFVVASYVGKMPVDVSIPKLQKLIESQTDAKARIAIAQSMIDSIRRNRAVKSVKTLFEYFSKRFRNEKNDFLSRIIGSLADLGDLYLEFEADDWIPIMQFCGIMKLNDVPLFSLFQIFSSRLHWAISKNANVESCFQECWDFFNKEIHWFSFSQGSSIHGRVLMMTSSKAAHTEWESEKSKWAFAENLVRCICDFNRDHPKEQIAIPDWILSYLDSCVNEKTNEPLLSPRQMIRYFQRVPDKTLLVTYWKKMIDWNNDVFVDNEILRIMLKKHPEFILSKISRLLRERILPDSYFKSYLDFYEKCRIYDSYGLTEEMSKTCLNVLNNSEDSAMHPHAIRALAVLLPSDEYLKLASRYVPSSSKVDEFSNEFKQLYDVQKAVCQSIVDVSVPAEALPLLRQFCVGDYLKFAVGSMTGICVKVPEVKILPELKDSLDCSVSLRKHLLRMIARIAPVEREHNFIVELFKTERNVSLRLVLFQQIRKTFIDEPDDDSFNTFSSVVSQLTDEDEEALKQLLDLNFIDDVYLSPYLILIWQLIDSKWPKTMTSGKAKIIELMDKRLLNVLNEDFCDELLRFELSTKLPNSSPGRFLSLYLLHSPSLEVQAARLDKVMVQYKQLIASSWNNYSLGSGWVFTTRYIVGDFISQICQLACNGTTFRINPIQLLNELKKHVSEMKPEDSLDERLQVDLAIAHQLHYSGDSAYLSSVVELYKFYSQTYGLSMETTSIDILLQFVPFEERNQLAKELIASLDPTCQIVGINLLSKDVSQEADVPVYKSIIATLLEVTNPKVQIAAHSLFKNLTSSII